MTVVSAQALGYAGRAIDSPLRFLSPFANSSGRLSGSSMVSRMSVLTLASPPTSSHVTFGILGAPILSEYAERAVSRAREKSAAVRATPE